MGGFRFRVGNMKMFFPVLRLDDGHVQVGPFRADPDSGRVIADPWPMWIHDMFPHPSVIAEYPEWKPFGYSAWKDGGGVWALLRNPIRKEGMTGPEISVFFISRNGDRLETAHISNPDFSSYGLLRVYDNWVFAYGDLIHESDVVRSEVLRKDPFKRAIQEHMFCLGPGGVLVFPSGHLVYPNGKITHIFSSDRMIQLVWNTSANPDHVNTDDLICPLGFDGKTLWLLVAGINNPEYEWMFPKDDTRSLAIVRMELNEANHSSIEVVLLLENAQLSDVFHFRDGGWMVSIRELSGDFEERRYGERWFIRLPGSEYVEESTVFAGDGYHKLSGEMFFPDGEDGLLGIVEVEKEAGPGSKKLFLVEWRKGEVKMIELLPWSPFDMYLILEWPWLVVEGNGKRFVLFTRKVGGLWLPRMSISAKDLEMAIRKGARIENPDETVVLKGMMHRGGTIITHGYIGTDAFPFIASLRLSDDGLRLIDFYKTPYLIESYRYLRENESDCFYFKSRYLTAIRSQVFVLLEKNGEFLIGMTA